MLSDAVTRESNNSDSDLSCNDKLASESVKEKRIRHEEVKCSEVIVTHPVVCTWF